MDIGNCVNLFNNEHTVLLSKCWVDLQLRVVRSISLEYLLYSYFSCRICINVAGFLIIIFLQIHVSKKLVTFIYWQQSIAIFSLRISLYSDRIQENTDQKKLRIWTLFTQFAINIKIILWWKSVINIEIILWWKSLIFPRDSLGLLFLLCNSCFC